MKTALSGALFVAALYTSTVWATPETDAFAYLNTLRSNAGMSTLASGSILDTASEAHSSYMQVNNVFGHFETPGDTGFTGVQASDRAVAAGYSSRGISENVAAGQQTAMESVDGLMSAIYHRFGFLNEEIDTIGIGFVLGGSGFFSTYNMANLGITALCSGPSATGAGTFIVGGCADTAKKILVGDYDAALAAIANANPDVILWPQANAVDIPPAFFEESPDPLPDFSVSGNPISLQFNKHKVTTAGLTSIALFEDLTNTQIASARLRLLDVNTDPNSKFSDHQFALFPLDRLEWNTRYRVEAAIVKDGVPSNLNWTFTTRSLGIPTFAIAGSADLIEVESGTEIAVYVRPQASQPLLGGVGFTFSDGSFVPQLSFIDGNTVKITYSDPTIGNQATFTAGNYSFIVRIRAAIAAADGDLAPPGNLDGIVSLADALVALRYALGLITPVTQDILNHGDVAPPGSPDGLMKIADALIILRVALGLTSL